MEKSIFIFSNEREISKKTEKRLGEKLRNAGYRVLPEYSADAGLLVCIGGDGTFLKVLHKFDFPRTPIIGINTGHLGFFHEIAPSKIDGFISDYSEGRYSIQELVTIKLKIREGDKVFEHIGLNEMAVKSGSAYAIHLSLSIGEDFIEKFSGDGLLISTPSGSTAYNYSLGGSIIDPRLEVLQITPIAPMNSTTYRSFTSSLILPPDLSLTIIPDMMHDSDELAIIHDGYLSKYKNADKIEIAFSDRPVRLLRFENYKFWRRVKDKFL